MKTFRLAFRFCALLLVFVTGAASARDVLLSLGDSVAFGYITEAGYEYGNPENFVGYPEYLGRFARLEVLNPACPGETSGSFLSATAPDNGCRAFRSQAPLHVSYSTTQLKYALGALTRHLDEVKVITLALGANDGFLLEDACAATTTSTADYTACVTAGLPQVVDTIAANITTILEDVRATGYRGRIVLVNYYSLDYSDAAATGLTQALNAALDAPASAFDAEISDTFTAFLKVAGNARFGGNSCKAGLLNASPANQYLCDVHPSQSGQRLIARTIARTIDEQGER